MATFHMFVLCILELKIYKVAFSYCSNIAVVLPRKETSMLVIFFLESFNEESRCAKNQFRNLVCLRSKVIQIKNGSKFLLALPDNETPQSFM